MYFRAWPFAPYLNRWAYSNPGVQMIYYACMLLGVIGMSACSRDPSPSRQPEHPPKRIVDSSRAADHGRRLPAERERTHWEHEVEIRTHRKTYRVGEPIEVNIENRSGVPLLLVFPFLGLERRVPTGYGTRWAPDVVNLCDFSAPDARDSQPCPELVPLPPGRVFLDTVGVSTSAAHGEWRVYYSFRSAVDSTTSFRRYSDTFFVQP